MVLWPLSPKHTAPTAPARDVPQIKTPTLSPHILTSVALFSLLSLTRIGHWMFDLMIQELEQVEIPPSQRSTFAGTEQSFRAFFQLSHWGATVIWNRPEDFKWLALGSLVVLGIGVSVFAVWSKKEMMNGKVRYEEIALDDVG